VNYPNNFTEEEKEIIFKWRVSNLDEHGVYGQQIFLIHNIESGK
jgi:hypothetical protein